MKRTVFVIVAATVLMTGCTIGYLGNRHGGNIVIVPALPVTVEIDTDRFYYQSGYYYSYRGEVWFYASSRQGPWVQLPRDRYPREVHIRKHDNRDNENRDRNNKYHD